MKLRELDPEWVRWEDRYLTAEEEKAEGVFSNRTDRRHTYIPVVQTLHEAQGIEFDCPKCRDPNRAHRIQVAFHGRGVLEHHGSRNKDGKPTRWHVVGGSSFDDLSLSPSIDCTPSDPNCWHGHITAGEAK